MVVAHRASPSVRSTRCSQRDQARGPACPPARLCPSLPFLEEPVCSATSGVAASPVTPRPRPGRCALASYPCL